MRRHAWNCDLSTKPGTDILTNRHIYIYIYIYITTVIGVISLPFFSIVISVFFTPGQHQSLPWLAGTRWGELWSGGASPRALQCLEASANRAGRGCFFWGCSSLKSAIVYRVENRDDDLGDFSSDLGVYFQTTTELRR